MRHKFFVALGIRPLPQDGPGLAPLPEVSLWTHLSINNSGLKYRLIGYESLPAC